MASFYIEIPPGTTPSGFTVYDVTASAPLHSSGGPNPNISITKANSTTDGYLSAVDWNIFNNKLDASSDNYITNADAEVDTTGWNLYNNVGRTVPASVIISDLTYIAVGLGNIGNDINVDYIFHATQPSSTPLVTVVSPTHITVAWYNGPTLANNPTAAQLKAAWDAVPGAVALVTVTITGTASNRQYITGSHLLANGGDTSPTDGTGGVTSGISFSIDTSTPLVGTSSFDLNKNAINGQGQGLSTDFQINSVDLGSRLQINFIYSGSTGIVLGSSSDVRIFLYDITNAALIPVIVSSIPGPINTAKEYVAHFTASSSSVNYRLIFHIATTSATAWDLFLDNIIVNDNISPVAATQVPSLVLSSQPISGTVTDHMVVMWRDGATQWIPATIAGAVLPAFGDDRTQLGFVTNIVGLTADVYIRGAMDGFSFGPFAGYEQYIDNTAGLISPLPSPFNDMYVMCGMAISPTVLNIQFDTHVSLISNVSGVPLKGGLLSNSGVNDGTGDQVLTVGANGNALIANSAATLGVNWAPAIIAAAPFTYTLATRTLTAATASGAVTGFLSAADWTTFNNKAPLASPIFTGTPSLPTGTIAITQGAGNSTTAIATTAFVTAADNLKANLASPTFTGTPTLPTGTIGTTQVAGNSTTALATTAFVTTAGNLKAPLASPVFTGDVNSSTGNLLASTIGKGLQVKTGANAKIGTVALVGGTATVANTSVTVNSRIFFSVSAVGGTQGFLKYTKIAATSFTVSSTTALDTSTLDWYIVESIP